MAHVLVIGGGIGGQATALLAGPAGTHRRALRTRFPAPGTAPRPRLLRLAPPHVPQATQPQPLLGAARTVLRGELPDVYAEMLRLGARERNELDWFDERPPTRPGDDDLVMIQPGASCWRAPWPPRCAPSPASWRAMGNR
ncbi:hypothetical protein ACFSNO_24145 [Streptomyces cirratus]